VSANKKLSPPRFCGPLFSCLIVGILLCTPALSRADTLEDSARALARRVAAALHGAPITCEERNLSTLDERLAQEFGAAFLDELQRQGLRIVKRDEGAEIVLTISQNVRGYVAIVHLQHGDNSEVLIESLGGTARPSRLELATVNLHKELMLSQEQPLVDADVSRYVPKNLYTLGPQQIAFYEWKENKWEIRSSQTLVRKRAALRDLRGIVGHSVDATAGLFPGEACRPAMQSWNCESYPGELVTLSVDRDFLESKKSPPWLSAAHFEMSGHNALVVTGKDGLARVYSDGTEALTIVPGWGSEIASIYSGCGTGWQVVTTGKGDWTSADSLAAFEIEEQRVTSVSDPLDLPGPVIAMHETASDKIPDGDMAIAVIHNLETGFYEVYRVTITCAK
jgi:hypothetical protein